MSLFFAIFGSEVAVLFTGPSYLTLILTENCLPLVSFLFCVLEADKHTANGPNKAARHAVYACCTVKGCNIVYTYLYTTAVNHAHPTTKFTLQSSWVGTF